MEKTPKTLAENIKWLREHTELDSQAKLGLAAGIDQRTVGRIMNCENYPTLDKLILLAAAVRIEAWQLLAPQFGAGLYRINKDLQIVPVQGPKATRGAGDPSGKPDSLAA